LENTNDWACVKTRSEPNQLPANFATVPAVGCGWRTGYVPRESSLTRSDWLGPTDAEAQAPNSKHQTSEKLQFPTSKDQTRQVSNFKFSIGCRLLAIGELSAPKNSNIGATWYDSLGLTTTQGPCRTDWRSRVGRASPRAGAWIFPPHTPRPAPLTSIRFDPDQSPPGGCRKFPPPRTHLLRISNLKFQIFDWLLAGLKPRAPRPAPQIGLTRSDWLGPTDAGAEAPKSKHQTSEKLQIPTSKDQTRQVSNFKFEISNFRLAVGCWRSVNFRRPRTQILVRLGTTRSD